MGNLRRWQHFAPDARRAAIRADRFAALHESALTPGRRERIGRSSRQVDRDAAPARPTRHCVLLGRTSLRDPVLDSDPILYRYALKPTGWDAIGSIGFLFVRGPFYDILRTYTVNESSFILARRTPTTDIGYPARVMRQHRRQLVDLGQIVRQILSESESLIEAAKDHIRAVDELNARIIRVLSTVNGHNLDRTAKPGGNGGQKSEATPIYRPRRQPARI